MADEAFMGAGTARGAVRGPADVALRHRFAAWPRRRNRSLLLAIALASAALISGVLTYAAMSGLGPFTPDPQTVLALLYVDLVLLLSLSVLIATRLVQLWIGRQRGAAGARLHTRMATLFGLVTLAPTIAVAVFSALFLHFGMQSWFSEKVTGALNRSMVVAETYIKEQDESIRISALAAALNFNTRAGHLVRNQHLMPPLLAETAEALSFTDAVVLRRSGDILARNDPGAATEMPLPSDSALGEAEKGRFVILPRKGDRVRALLRLINFADAYLYVTRSLDAQVVDHMQQIEAAVTNYRQVEEDRYGIQITFVAIFILVALLVLLSAVWMGLLVADRIAGPIGSLIAAADRVRKGELATRVSEPARDDEIGSLSRAFNRMTGQIHSQQQELQDANRQLDDRRRFTEAVLAGVSAGVIGLDAGGRITLPNPSALRLLDAAADALASRSLEDAIPEMAALLAEARLRPHRLVGDQVELVRGERRRTLLVRIVTERAGGGIDGFVVTFDDITALVSAQRRGAWADVAQRLAHEIKNPLTPIKLSAQRLRRKYRDEIHTEPDVFEECTDTIVRQVGDIRQMIDEFSSFARMPAPVPERIDLLDVIEQAVTLQRLAHPAIGFKIECPPGGVHLDCDPRQIGRALTNVLKNAIEAIESCAAGAGPAGRVRVRVREAGGQWRVEIADNGPGLPAKLRDRLTEPYVTNRKEGSGLGLAIVRRIMEDHGGRLVLQNGSDGGARVTLVFAAAGTERPSPADCGG